MDVQPLEQVSGPARMAEPGDGITVEELALASRNHAMPMEAMRYDVTPVGLHYVLVHYDIPDVPAEEWTLAIGGAVARPLLIDHAALLDMPRQTVRVTFECAGNGRAGLEPRPISQPWLTGAVGTADWTGVRLADLLADAGPATSAVDVVFTGADHGVERGVEQDYARSLPLADAMAEDVIVAYEMNGSPLPVQHGFPARLVVPGWYGMAQVKWLRTITIIEAPFAGYQNLAYRLRQVAEDEGIPVTRMEPRALLIPPGFPDFETRARVVDAGSLTITGRAWSGWGPIAGIQVSVDGGATWVETELDQPASPWAWCGFHTTWQAVPGMHELRVRARDLTGREQPVEPRWNRGGFANNADQAVRVLVR
jgi:DMSO/TMAO reductase YedYZ molybdopterin-dependent catalytic subunit